MTIAIILASSGVLVAVLALALAREIRLRRALQRLLAKLLRYWRPHETHVDVDPDDPDARRL